MDEPSVFDSWRSTVVLGVITGALASVLLAAENTATGGQAFWSGLPGDLATYVPVMTATFLVWRWWRARRSSKPAA
jgi:hypothetical protein